MRRNLKCKIPVEGWGVWESAKAFMKSTSIMWTLRGKCGGIFLINTTIILLYEFYELYSVTRTVPFLFPVKPTRRIVQQLKIKKNKVI